MKFKVCSVALSALAAAYAGHAADDPFWADKAPESECKVAVKVNPGNNMPLVEAEVEGVKCTLLVDTGATHTTFDMSFVKRNMPDKELVPVMLTAESNVEGAPRFMKVKSLKIGDAEFGEFGAMALDISHLPSAVGAKVDGILGMSTLGRVPCLISLGSGEMAFVPGRETTEGFERPVKRSLSDPMSVLLPVKFGERTVELLVDSGCSKSFLSSDTLWPTTGEAADMPAVDINGSTGLRPQMGARGVLAVGEGLEIAPLVVAEPMNRIGSDVLTAYDMLIAGRYVFFRPCRSAAPAEPQPVAQPQPVEQPLPPPGLRLEDVRPGDKPVAVETSESVVEENAFFRRVRTTFVFTNANVRDMAGELEFPLPAGASVCGYSLEVDGELVPGVVCEKEKARVAFENETRKGVDPGLVEHVKGNVWRTRIFPLRPATPRRAVVEHVAPKAAGADAPSAVYERDGDDVFVATVSGAAQAPGIAARIAAFAKGTILWDASMSAKAFAAGWRGRLEALPDGGEWNLVVFRNVAEEPRAFADRASLLAAIDALEYDGGTDIGAAVEAMRAAGGSTASLLFTDEVDTLGLADPRYEDVEGLVVASRSDAPVRPVSVRRLSAGENPPEGAEVRESHLLATVWAARRMEDLAAQADGRKGEFIALGRKYGVAGPGLSLIVFETLDQWLEYKVEPPADLAIHAEWVRRRAAEDDPIAERKAKAEHEQRLLQYWEERVKWWRDPKPPRKTPKSGLFDGIANMFGGRSSSEPGVGRSVARREAAAPAMEMEDGVLEEEVAAVGAPAAEKAKPAEPGAAGSGAAPTVSLKAWDPNTPYMEALKAAANGEAYKAYLRERDAYGSSPAFHIDCAGWFFKAGETALAERILSNLAEFKLEDAALWRSMGWRAREAGSYALAIRAFRKALALRGEEAQSRRDLALVLMEHGKEVKDASEIEEAMRLLHEAAFSTNARRSGRRGNDFQVSVIALEELNGLIAWADAVEWPDGAKPTAPAFDEAYRRDLPVKLRIVMSWSADETDIDLHVLEPNGEEAFYGNRRTAEGGFVSEDVTTGYGPEEYLKKDMERGTYKVLSNYFASHQTALTGATTVTATVYTDWATAEERRQILTLRLDKPKEKHLIGEVEL